MPTVPSTFCPRASAPNRPSWAFPSPNQELRAPQTSAGPQGSRLLRGKCSRDINCLFLLDDGVLPESGTLQTGPSDPSQSPLGCVWQCAAFLPDEALPNPGSGHPRSSEPLHGPVALPTPQPLKPSASAQSHWPRKVSRAESGSGLRPVCGRNSRLSTHSPFASPYPALTPGTCQESALLPHSGHSLGGSARPRPALSGPEQDGTGRIRGLEHPRGSTGDPLSEWSPSPYPRI